MRPRYTDLPGGDAKGVYGSTDEIGSLNLLTAERTVAAAALVRTGRVISLNAPITEWPDPNPPASPRSVPEHAVFDLVPGVVLDDRLDNYFPQGSSQWDGFLHVRDPRTGSFYNGHTQHSTGVDAWARRGIVGRGVLLDVARWLAENGEPIDWQKRRPVTANELAGCAASQGVTITEGTILLIRVGWETGYRALDHAGRVAYAKSTQAAPGLQASAEMAACLWDWGVAAVVCDNIAVEAKPYDVPHQDILHAMLLPRLGIPMGELWLLDKLAEACAEENRFEFLLTSAPMNLPGGVGSPANALAVM